MSFSYLFDPNKQFQDRNGVNNVGGFLRVYIDGTDDRATTYKDFNGTLNEADIMLDTDGRAVVIVDDNLTFRIEVYERDGALQWTVTQFTARGEGGGGGSSTPVVVDGTANEIDVTESMTAGVKYYTIGLATVVKNTLLGLLASFSNLVGILNSKVDKVQGATAGNLAALDASGNLTDSGSKVADFKTKQTPVADPSASGAGLEFIDSVSQNANGEINPHKKSVQDGTTAQKGVVKLSNAIDSTSVTEAATPKAVKDAYDELNNKIVARAVFLSQAEWDVQSQLQGDPAKVYYVENGTGEDAYTVYVWKESTSTYEEVDESSIDLDGYWHDSPTTTGSGNVVTDITLGNDGVPQVTKGLTALTQHQDISGKLDKTGDASNTTSTLTKASGDTSSMTSGNKLSVLFTSISSFFASVASALGGKADKVTSATNGNFASLDSSGNLTDSGKKAADFDKKRYSWDTHGMYRVFKNPNTDVSNKWVKLAEVDASSITDNNKAIQFTGYVYNYGQNKRIFTKFVKVPFSAVFDITNDSQGVVVGNISGIDPLFNLPRVNDLIRIEKIDSKHWILELYTYSYQAYSLEIEASALYSSILQIIVWASSDLTDTAPGTGAIINSTLDDYDNCVNSIKASDYASGSALESAINAKQDTISDLTTIRSGASAGATALQPSGNGSNLSVTPDGTSTGYDLGSSTTLKAFAQKFKNLVSALKALAFKDKASYNDLSSGVQSSLDKANSALQSHQSVTDNNPTLAWGSTSTIGTVGSTDLRVTMPSNPAQNIPSVINNLTSDSTNDALSAAQGKVLKENSLWETHGINNIACFDKPLDEEWDENNRGIFSLHYTVTDYIVEYLIIIQVKGTITSSAPLGSNGFVRVWSRSVNNIGTEIVKFFVEGNKLTIGFSASSASRQLSLSCYGKRPLSMYCRNMAGNIWTNISVDKSYYSVTKDSDSNIGSPTIPVYVDSNGQVQPCDVLSGGTSNFNRTFTTTYTVGSTDQYITTAIKNDNIDLIADYVTWHNAKVGKLTSPPMIIIKLSARTAISNAGLITLNMYKTGNGCDVFGESYTNMGNQHGSIAYNTQYFTDQTFVSGSAYYLNIRNETPNTMWAAGTILDISIRIVAHAVSVT